jgi:type II secretory pathway component GspD/PulD (secretin)
MEGGKTMKKVVLIAIFVIMAIFLVSVNPGLAQEVRPKMRQEIVKLKYIDKNEILSVLLTFASREGRISPSPESGLITVSDYPENVEKILEVIRKLDVKPADIQFSIQLVLGSAAGEEKSDEALLNDPVIKELKTLLKYKSFSLLDTSFIRAIDRESSQVTMGKDAELRLDLRPKYIQEEKEDLIQVEARLYKMQGFMQGQNTQLSTTLLTSNFTMKSGEKTVVGVSKMDGGDKGLILIISGKVIK